MPNEGLASPFKKGSEQENNPISYRLPLKKGENLSN